MRTKTVFQSGMVAHLWAHQSQHDGRNSSGNFYFHGDTIYSYGGHFPIARHATNKRGDKAVLFTTRTYSSTTAGHVCAVESACRHLQVFHVDHVDNTDPRKDVEGYRNRFRALVGKYAKARAHKPAILADLRRLVQEANGYAEFFRLRSRLTLPNNLSGMVAECQAMEKKEKAERKREEAKRALVEQKRIADWVAGKSDYPATYWEPIRLRIKGDELQTSKGARVPLAHAVRAFKVIKRLHDKGQAYQRNGHTIHLGHFALDAIDGQGNVTAGCHTVAWEEIERVATLAGVN